MFPNEQYVRIDTELMSHRQPGNMTARPVAVEQVAGHLFGAADRVECADLQNAQVLLRQRMVPASKQKCRS
jgi:hypothetical protein